MSQKYNKGDTVCFKLPNNNTMLFGFIKTIDSLNDFHDSIMNSFYEISTSNGKFLNENRIYGEVKILLIEKHVKI